jgi:Icc-related predicted phosphoesterase
MGIQKKFVNGYLKKFYQRCKDKNIDILAFFGNDDLYPRKKYFKKYAALLDETPFVKNGYEFMAYPYVQDYRFGLKTACKLDYPGWACPEPYTQTPSDFTEKGRIVIGNTEEYFANKGTIEGDLRKIHATNKTIMAIHQPPWSLDLDVCRDGRRVGSVSVFDWIQREQPLLVLCGHVHESPQISHVWKANIGKTLVIQPGQWATLVGLTTEIKTTLVYIEISDTEDLLPLDTVNAQMVTL